MTVDSLGEIVFVDPGNAFEDSAGFYIYERSFLGYKAYKDFLEKNYPDVKFTVVTEGGVIDFEKCLNPSTCRRFSKDDINLRKESADEYLQNAKGNVVALVLGKKGAERFLSMPCKVVYVAEVTRRIRYAIFQAESSRNGKIGMADTLRAYLGLWKGELATRKMMRKSAGIQCNGPAVFESYGNLSKNSFLYFDHRVDGVAKEKDFNKSSKSIAFSGNISPLKGSKYIADISWAIYNLNPEIVFYLIGDGVDRQDILEKGAPNIVYKGFMSYKDEWEPFVQENIDLMVMPHLQGDPSMTYYETLGQGVPIIGFSNETLDFLVSQKMAWSVPQGDVQQLARKIDEILRAPDELAAASVRARRFMTENLYSRVLARRIDHLVSILKEKAS